MQLVPTNHTQVIECWEGKRGKGGGANESFHMVALEVGWVEGMRSMCDLRCSVSKTGSSTATGYFGSLTFLFGGPGSGNLQVRIWMVSTPNENVSSFLE